MGGPAFTTESTAWLRSLRSERATADPRSLCRIALSMRMEVSCLSCTLFPFTNSPSSTALVSSSPFS